MKISARGLALIKEFEGCLTPISKGKFKPYICPAGVLTIGWGHTNHHGRQFDADTVWTQADCDRALKEDLSGFERSVEKLVKVKLNQNQFDALVSFTYNCGEGNLSKSTLLRKLNKGDYEGAAAQFAAWNKGAGKVLKGLVRRRAAEAELFRAPARAKLPPIPTLPDVEPVPKEPMPQQVDPPKQDRPSIFERLWAWLTGGAGVGAAAFFTDWRVVTVIAVSLCIVASAAVLLIGPEHVRDWLRRKVNR